MSGSEISKSQQSKWKLRRHTQDELATLVAVVAKVVVLTSLPLLILASKGSCVDVV